MANIVKVGIAAAKAAAKAISSTNKKQPIKAQYINKKKVK
jgi:hypothetical protein